MTSEGSDPFGELAAELRLGAGEELRAEAELDEAETEIGRRRRRTVADLARRAMHRGDTVTVHVAGLTLSGVVDAVGLDYLVLLTPATAADVRLDAAVLRISPAPSGGHDARPGSATFAARLAEYEQTGEDLTLHLATDPPSVVGSVAVAAGDHVLVSSPGAGDVVIPLPLVVAVTRPRPAPHDR